MNEYNIHVYVLLDPETQEIKIGQTKDLSTRIKQIETDLGRQVMVLAVIEDVMPLEQILHLQFAHLNAHGDWFHYDPEIVGFVNSLHMTNSMGNPFREEPEPETHTLHCPYPGCSWYTVKERRDVAERSLRAHRGMAHPDYEVVVSDNGEAGDSL